ncbi:unnamed protein product, partial [Prorocentrum cordatum]
SGLPSAAASTAASRPPWRSCVPPRTASWTFRPWCCSRSWRCCFIPPPPLGVCAAGLRVGAPAIVREGHADEPRGLRGRRGPLRKRSQWSLPVAQVPRLSGLLPRPVLPPGFPRHGLLRGRLDTAPPAGTELRCQAGWTCRWPRWKRPCGVLHVCPGLHSEMGGVPEQERLRRHRGERLQLPQWSPQRLLGPRAPHARGGRPERRLLGHRRGAITASGIAVVYLILAHVAVFNQRDSDWYVQERVPVLVLAGLVSFLVGHAFMTIFDVVSDTILYCRCIEEVRRQEGDYFLSCADHRRSSCSSLLLVEPMSSILRVLRSTPSPE